MKFCRDNEPQVRTIVSQNGGRRIDGEHARIETVPTLIVKQWETFLAWRLKQSDLVTLTNQAE